ncbi:putative NTP pyrophosphohydrolase [Gordonia effusa NBRC 100432]|uniref:8-oxo-dGTP diphosphatase n=1 Tax=Gordonia effusa NBRC 100432 TaxID=1077974 RepID=H0R1J9_9ACTN|nr:NUDIX domain-containing protein [Gordonia effusa]GAB18950.1 putative NTP pyrophosphohydrolase [Gordonia effusa NBRC 100432]
MKTVVAAAIVRDQKLLLAQRSYPDDVAGLWELPGGKVEDGEAVSVALEREIAEELSVRIGIGRGVGEPVVLRDNLILVARHAWLVEGEPVAVEHSAVTWVSAGELGAMARAGELVPADAVWLDDLVALLGESE